MASPVYMTQSGTTYSIDDKKRMIRNNQLLENGAYEYEGLTEWNKAVEELHNACNQSPQRDAMDPHHLMFILFNEKKIASKQLAFDEAKDNLDGKTSLVFVSKSLEKVLVTTPLTGFKSDL